MDTDIYTHEIFIVHIRYTGPCFVLDTLTKDNDGGGDHVCSCLLNCKIMYRVTIVGNVAFTDLSSLPFIEILLDLNS